MRKISMFKAVLQKYDLLLESLNIFLIDKNKEARTK